jgi:phosphoglycolate phosphatase
MGMNRLLLFDIDGTLVAGGPAKEAFHEALLAVFGTAGPIESWDFSGKTDPQIARELLVEAGLDAERITAGLDGLFEHYLKGMEARLPAVPTRALPGVVSLMAELDRRSRAGTVGLGLVTGNHVRGAALKLGSAGLDTPFFPASGESVGAFGSDHEERNELPAIALQRAKRSWRIDFEADNVVIIGDTPRDVACGQAHGMRTIGVATGGFSATELERSGADIVVEDFSETERMLRFLLD